MLVSRVDCDGLARPADLDNDPILGALFDVVVDCSHDDTGRRPVLATFCRHEAESHDSSSAIVVNVSAARLRGTVSMSGVHVLAFLPTVTDLSAHVYRSVRFDRSRKSQLDQRIVRRPTD